MGVRRPSHIWEGWVEYRHQWSASYNKIRFSVHPCSLGVVEEVRSPVLAEQVPELLQGWGWLEATQRMRVRVRVWVQVLALLP